MKHRKEVLNRHLKTSAKPINYRDAITRKKVVNKNKIIINRQDTNACDRKIKHKIFLAMKKLNVTFFKKVNINTIINAVSKVDSKKLLKYYHEIIKNVNVQEKILDSTTI